jgi:hypothetical protein
MCQAFVSNNEQCTFADSTGEYKDWCDEMSEIPIGGQHPGPVTARHLKGVTTPFSKRAHKDTYSMHIVLKASKRQKLVPLSSVQA